MTTDTKVTAGRNQTIRRAQLANASATENRRGRTAVVLVIRDPDHENTFVVDGEAETIDIDLGRGFDGPKGFRALSDEEQREWIESTIANVAHLPVDSNVRKAVEELVEEIAP